MGATIRIAPSQLTAGRSALAVRMRACSAWAARTLLRGCLNAPSSVSGFASCVNVPCAIRRGCISGLLSLDLTDTTMFGEPFDQAAAARAVEWAREQLAGRVAD